MAELSSLAWGGKSFPVTQGFIAQGVRPDWYAYSANYGMPAGAHIALDVGVPKMTPIYALNPGEVIQEGFSDSFRPNPVTIKAYDNPDTPLNESGYVEIYGHLWQEVVSKGQQVKAGDFIGYSGEQTYKGTMTPDGSGPHIHFEARKPTPGQTPSGYTAIDPTGYLQGREGTQLGDITDAATGVVTGDISGVLSSIGSSVTILIRRGFIVVVGLVLLYLGVNSLLKLHSGIDVTRSIKRTGKKAGNLIPAGRAVNAVA